MLAKRRQLELEYRLNFIEAALSDELGSYSHKIDIESDLWYDINKGCESPDFVVGPLRKELKANAGITYEKT